MTTVQLNFEKIAERSEAECPKRIFDANLSFAVLASLRSEIFEKLK